MKERIGFGPRLGAFAIDVVLVWVLAFVLSKLFPSFLLESTRAQLEQTLSANPMLANLYDENMISIMVSATRVGVLVNVARLLYFLPEIFIGKSLGKLMLGLQIVGVEGGQASPLALLSRYLIKHIGKVCAVLSLLVASVLFNTFGNLLGLVVFVGCFFSASEKHQALHDSICGTIVVKKSDENQNSTEVSNWI